MRRTSGCKVNLLLNILGKRADGFHELESVMFPVPIAEELQFERSATAGIHLTCSHPELPTDSGNLVYRAAARFFEVAHLEPAIRIHLEKRLPLAAGLGGGSANAAVTLQALNELHGEPLEGSVLGQVAAGVGSDVPFFLQDGPAVALGRGEQVESLAAFDALRGRAMILVHPGFGVSTPWAYRALADFPEALHGRPGRAQAMVAQLQSGDLEGACASLYNSLEAPVLNKYPLLRLYQEFLRQEGAMGVLMSGSGSTTFALAADRSAAEGIMDRFVARFGAGNWIAVAAL